MISTILYSNLFYSYIYEPYLTARFVCMLVAPLWCDLGYCSRTVLAIKGFKAAEKPRRHLYTADAIPAFRRLGQRHGAPEPASESGDPLTGPVQVPALTRGVRVQCWELRRPPARPPLRRRRPRR